MTIHLRVIQRVLFLVVIFGLTPFASARADLLVNGDFSDGLTGWTVSDPNSVEVIGGQAVLRESSTASEVVLYQDFLIPVGVQSLSFTLVGVGQEDDFLVSGFGAALLDPNTLASLVDTTDAFSDSFYTRDLDFATSRGIAAMGVTLSPQADGLPLQITLDVSALGGRDARILFRLIGGGGSSDASVTLDNVLVGTTTAVPEPSSLVLLAVGVFASIRKTRPGR